MKKYDKFMKGKNAENLDGAIRESFKQIEKINRNHKLQRKKAVVVFKKTTTA